MQSHTMPCVILPYPPKWMKSRCGARFAFGGKLITCPAQDGNETTHSVDVFQVVTEPAVFEKASEFYVALTGDGSSLNLPLISDLCGRRAEQTSSEAERCVWQCLQAHVQRQSRERYVEIVGCAADRQSLAEKMKTICNISLSRSEESESLVNGAASPSSQDNLLSADQEYETEDEEDTPLPPWPVTDGIGQLELPTDPQSRGGLLCQLISACKFSTAVELCIAEDRWVEAMQISQLGSRHLHDQVQRRYYERLKDPVSKFICLLANDRWDLLISSVSLRHPDSWRQVFAILMGYVQTNVLNGHLERLGKRMESAGTGDIRSVAPACYILSGGVEQLVENQATQNGTRFMTAEQLHDIVEKATILRVSIGGGCQKGMEVGPQLADKLGRYSNLLVEQGCVALAVQLLDALPDDTDQNLMELRYRLFTSYTGFLPSNIRRPKVPFATVSAPAVVAQYQQPQQQYQPAPWSRSGSYVPPPPLPSGQVYGSNAAVPQQAFSQPPPAPPTSVAGAPGQAQVSAMKTTRNRYPSYNSDGISYPSQVSGIPPAYSAAASPSYQPHQQYSGYPAPASAYPQQQPPPTPTVQQPAYSNASASYRPPPINTAGYVSHIGHHSSASSIPQPSLPPPPPGPATELQHRPWNDPPPLSPKKKNAPKVAELPQPVTFPVFGAGGAPSAIDSMPPQHPYYQPEEPGVYQPLLQQSAPQSAQHSPSPVPAPVVPSEHENVISVLSRLGELTAAQAPNVQTRRRIEGGLQKLNTNLPSLLASGKLSKTTLAELHQLVNYIRAYDYNSALVLHAHIVEGSDFSTIASFMPSVKVLIQSAVQMGVYYS